MPNQTININHNYDGFLFIGDVHITSRRPGRRLDDYASACLAKLEQASSIAKERNLYPICLGDLFHRSSENDIGLLSRLMAVLRQFNEPLLVLAGSHDRAETWFTEKDAANLLADSGALNLVQDPGKVLSLSCRGQSVDLFATPAGCLVPESVESEADHAIMITHHDFDFNGMYPGAHELKEIMNCQLLVNGHMHHPTPSVMKGSTACHNPGSLTRPSVDLKNHKPVVSVWTPAHGLSLESVELNIVSDVFDMTGKEVFAAEPRELKASLPKGLRLSSFASKLRQAEDLEANRTEDGSILVEELETYFKLFESPDNLKRYLTGLVAEVVEEQHSK